MNGTDTCAGQHRHRRFNHHWHIDSDYIAFFHAKLFQHVAETTDIVMQFAIGNGFAFLWVITFPDDRRLVSTLF